MVEFDKSTLEKLPSENKMFLGNLQALALDVEEKEVDDMYDLVDLIFGKILGDDYTLSDLGKKIRKYR
jgi:hypothetical protein